MYPCCSSRWRRLLCAAIRVQCVGGTRSHPSVTSMGLHTSRANADRPREPSIRSENCRTTGFYREAQRSEKADAPAAESKQGQTSAKGPSTRPREQGDNTRVWVAKYIEDSVARGQSSKEAAMYFDAMLSEQGDLTGFLKGAQHLLQGQDPARLTPYQRGLFLDHFGQLTASKVSQRLQRARAEEEAGKRFTQEGRPTDDRYWLEAGNTLALLDVPSYVKDEILNDMRRDRPRDSPANEEPEEMARLEAQSDGFAEHMRKQRRKLLNMGSDVEKVS